MAKLNKRLCKQCKKEFQKTSPLQSCCSVSCAIERSYDLNKAKREKLLCDKVMEMKKGLMKKGDWIKLLQITFNTFIRVRDKNLPCISCGKTKVEEFHAGHYIATTYQYHRFNEDNVHKQCSQCNTHLRGNLIPYRIELIKKIGLERVEYLENTRHMMLEITIPDIKEQIKKYKIQIKSLKSKI
tara:strand:- start:2708 stop:3259 length:552 start_codon:yes stop_codon:yes gene_type:complete